MEDKKMIDTIPQLAVEVAEREYAKRKASANESMDSLIDLVKKGGYQLSFADDEKKKILMSELIKNVM